jgi:stringent starvation protein B
MTSTKPYLMRAIFEWAEDNGFTPQVLVNAEGEGVEVPTAHVVDGQIVLNISSGAVKLHVMDNECLSFSARFSGVEQDIFLPIESILAIFARENSQGIFFEEVDEDDLDPDPSSPAKTNAKTVVEPTKLKTKRSSSHLKIIK